MAEPIDQSIVDALQQGIWTEDEREQALMMLVQVEETPAEQQPAGEVE